MIIRVALVIMQEVLQLLRAAAPAAFASPAAPKALAEGDLIMLPDSLMQLLKRSSQARALHVG